MSENEKLVERLREGADWPEVRPISASELREAATALTLAQARIRELETALAAREAPEGWMMVPVDPKDEHMGENYTDGLWSRRNWEAALEDIAAAIRKG